MTTRQDLTIDQPEHISATDLHTLLQGNSELAVIDVRDSNDLTEQGAMLLATHVPLSALRTSIGRLVPLRSTRIVLLDLDGGALARRASRILDELSYTGTQILRGGIKSWEAKGYVLYKTSYIFGLAFATFLEHVRPSPYVSADELAAQVGEPNSPLILDARNADEFRVRSLPGAQQATGTDIVHRSLSAFEDSERPLVITCAGYTRSIVAAHGLLNVSIPNPVRILKDGTKAWRLAGLKFEHDCYNPLPLPRSLDRQDAAAARLQKRFDIPLVDRDTLARIASAQYGRTTYFIDIRPTAAFDSGHLPGSRSVPSEQLTPWTLRHLAVLRSKIVLIDAAPALHASISASWIKQQGWRDVSIYLLSDLDDDLSLSPPSTRGTPTYTRRPIAYIDIDQIVEGVTADVLVLDVSSSTHYEKEHIPGAKWISQAYLGTVIARFSARQIVLTAQSVKQAEDAYLDVCELTSTSVAVLRGANDAWRESGRSLSGGMEHIIGRISDTSPDKWEVEDWRARFLALIHWEDSLPASLARDATSPFVEYPEL